MYLNHGLEGEEVIYVTSEDGFYRLKGHSIYYERNQMMQDYMILRKDAHRVESGTNDRITRDFRNKMQDRKIEVLKKRSKVNLLGGACGALSLALLAGGVVMFNNYNKMKEMEAVLVSVLPSGYEEWYENDIGAEDGGLLIEEAAGGVETTGAAQAGGGQAGDGQAGTHGDAGASWTYEETEMGPEEGAEVSEALWRVRPADRPVYLVIKLPPRRKAPKQSAPRRSSGRRWCRAETPLRGRTI